MKTSIRIASGVAILVVALASGCARADRRPWRLPLGETVSYEIVWDKAWSVQESRYQERDTVSLAISAMPGGSLAIRLEGRPPVVVEISPDGTVLPEDAEVPLLARFVLMGALPTGTSSSTGTTWELRWPSDAQVDRESDQLSLQAHHVYRVDGTASSGDRRLVETDVEGRLRVVDDPHLRSLLDLDGRPEVEAALARLAAWNYYLAGTYRWDSSASVLESADLTFAAIPAPRDTREALLMSEVRNHLDIRRRNGAQP